MRFPELQYKFSACVAMRDPMVEAEVVMMRKFERRPGPYVVFTVDRGSTKAQMPVHKSAWSRLDSEKIDRIAKFLIVTSRDATARKYTVSQRRAAIGV